MNKKSSVWPGLLAALLITSLLLVFYQVVRGTVDQSAIRNKATALLAESIWRCNALRGPGASASCLSQLKAQANDNVLLQAQDMPGAHPLNGQTIMMSKLDSLWNK